MPHSMACKSDQGHSTPSSVDFAWQKIFPVIRDFFRCRRDFSLAVSRGIRHNGAWTDKCGHVWMPTPAGRRPVACGSPMRDPARGAHGAAPLGRAGGQVPGFPASPRPWPALCGDPARAVAGRQGGAFRCGPRDRWIDREPERRFRRPDPSANNTRFSGPAEPGALPGPAPFFPAGMTRRLSRDRCRSTATASPGRDLPVSGTVRRRHVQGLGLARPGRHPGPDRANGGYTDPHGKPKRMPGGPRPAARPRDDAPAPRRTGGHPGLAEGAGRRAHGRLHAHGDRPGHARQHEGLQRRRAVRKGAVAGGTGGHRRLAEQKNRPFRTAGQVHDPQGVGGGGPRGTAGCAWAMAGNRETDRACARGGRQAHPGRQPERRGTPGTVAPGDHATGAPVGVPGHGDDGGEPAAMHGLPERSDIRGRAITPGALHTVRATARPGTERKGAACVFTGRASAPETHDTPGRIDRERDGQCDGDVDRAHGRTGQRRTGVPTPGPGTVTWPGIRRVARVRRRRESVLPADAGRPGTGTFHSTTSPGAGAASPRDLPAPTAVTGPWRARPPRARHGSRRGRLPDRRRERSGQPRRHGHDRAGRGVRRPPRGRGHHRSHAPPAAHPRGRGPGGPPPATGTRRTAPPLFFHRKHIPAPPGGDPLRRPRPSRVIRPSGRRSDGAGHRKRGQNRGITPRDTESTPFPIGVGSSWPCQGDQTPHQTGLCRPTRDIADVHFPEKRIVPVMDNPTPTNFPRCTGPSRPPKPRASPGDSRCTTPRNTAAGRTWPK